MLHYEFSEQGNQVLVLLHGFMENSTIWDFMEPFWAKEFKLLKIDLPGCGKSDVLSELPTMERMAEEVYKVLHHLKIEQFHLLGHSMGGYVALAFTEKYSEQVQSLTLFFSTTLEDRPQKKEIRVKSLALIEKNYPKFVSSVIPNVFSKNTTKNLKEKIKIAETIALSNNIDGLKASLLGMMERPNRTFVLCEFDKKIVLIAGKYDEITDYRDYFDEIPDRPSISKSILNCGHNGQWELPEICATLLNRELLAL